jgi:hypothetical protein
MRATKSTLRTSQVHAIVRGLVPCAVTFSVEYSRALEENAGRESWLLHSAPNRTLREVLPGAVPKVFDMNSFFNCSIFSCSQREAGISTRRSRTILQSVSSGCHLCAYRNVVPARCSVHQ